MDESIDPSRVRASAYSPAFVRSSICSVHDIIVNFQILVPSAAAVFLSVGVDTAYRHGALTFEADGVRRRTVAVAAEGARSSLESMKGYTIV